MKRNSGPMGKVLSAILAVSVLVSCSKDDTVDVNNDRANVAVIHASPGSPAVDLYHDTAKISSAPLSFGSYLGTPGNAYVQVPAGQHNIRLTNDGTTNVYEGSVNLEKDKNYSIFVYDTLNSGMVKTLLLQDAPASQAGNSNLRFLHLSPDAPAVDFWLANATDTIRMDGKSYIGDSPNVTELAAFTPVPAGNYTLMVRSGDAVVVDVPGVDITEGKNYTFYSKGLLNGTGDNALSIGTVQYN